MTGQPRQHDRSRERVRALVVRLLVAVLLGVVTTVAVSWGSAVWVSGAASSTKYLVQVGANRYDIQVGSSGPVTVFEWQDSTFEFAIFGDRTPLTAEELKLLAPIPTWSALHDPVRALGQSGTVHHELTAETYPLIREVGFGWPCLAMVTRFHDQSVAGAIEFVCTSGIPFRKNSTIPPSVGLVAPPAIPLQIHWPGFVTNAGLYGVAWFVVTALPAARRMIRVGRGRCAGCAYLLHGLPGGSRCPECELETVVAGRASRAAGAVIESVEANVRRLKAANVRRVLQRAVLAGLIGVVMTVGVAWGSAASFRANTSLPANIVVSSGGARLLGGLAENVSVSSVRWEDDANFKFYSHETTDTRSTWLDPPAWSLLRDPSAAIKIRSDDITLPGPSSPDWPGSHRLVKGLHETASGWPMRAMVARFRDAVESPQEVGRSYVCVSGIGLTEFRDVSGPLGPRGLPVVPYWPGFLTDVAFFGLVAYGVLFWRPSFRGRWRME